MLVAMSVLDIKCVMDRLEKVESNLMAQHKLIGSNLDKNLNHQLKNVDVNMENMVAKTLMKMNEVLSKISNVEARLMGLSKAQNHLQSCTRTQLSQVEDRLINTKSVQIGLMEARMILNTHESFEKIWALVTNIRLDVFDKFSTVDTKLQKMESVMFVKRKKCTKCCNFKRIGFKTDKVEAKSSRKSKKLVIAKNSKKSDDNSGSKKCFDISGYKMGDKSDIQEIVDIIDTKACGDISYVRDSVDKSDIKEDIGKSDDSVNDVIVLKEVKPMKGKRKSREMGKCTEIKEIEGGSSFFDPDFLELMKDSNIAADNKETEVAVKKIKFEMSNDENFDNYEKIPKIPKHIGAKKNVGQNVEQIPTEVVAVTVAVKPKVLNSKDNQFVKLKPDDFLYNTNNNQAPPLPLHNIIQPTEVFILIPAQKPRLLPMMCQQTSSRLSSISPVKSTKFAPANPSRTNPVVSRL